MANASSPFTGMKLSEQIDSPSAPLDQQLFGSVPANGRTVPTVEKAAGMAGPAKERSKERTNVGTKERTLEPRNVGNLQTASVEESPASSLLFDINTKPYKRNSYDFTDAELNALEDMKIDIRRKLDLDVTKNDLIRCAIHAIVDDFGQHGPQSSVVSRLRKKNPR